MIFGYNWHQKWAQEVKVQLSCLGFIHGHSLRDEIRLLANNFALTQAKNCVGQIESYFLWRKVYFELERTCDVLSFAGQKIRIDSILESTYHSLESTHISKRNRLKLNLFTLLIANGIISTLVNSELTRVNSNIRPWWWDLSIIIKCTFYNLD